jgi:hypothetical protein
MEKPHLPVNDISEREFNVNFKKRHLDNTVLSDEDLKAIKDVFGLGDKSENSLVGYLSCDEAHQHNYRCNGYHSPEAGIVDRLLTEIRRYQRIILTVDGICHHGPDGGE